MLLVKLPELALAKPAEVREEYSPLFLHFALNKLREMKRERKKDRQEDRENERKRKRYI